MGDCKHKRKKFITVTGYKGYYEKIYSCQDCGNLITDFADDQEAETFIIGNKNSSTTTPSGQTNFD